MKKYLAIAGAGLMMIGTAGLAAAATVDVGGEVRIKYENRENAAFDSDTSDQRHGTHQRTGININAKVSDEISGFIQLRNVRTWGSSTTSLTESDTATTYSATAKVGDGTTDNNTNTDVHQAYLQVNKVFGTPLSVRLGRQELSYGDQRLVGALDWSDVARSFDAVKVMYNSGDIALDVWAAKAIESSWATDSYQGSNNDRDFYGAWLTYKGLKDNVIDLYALWLRDGGAGYSETLAIDYGGGTIGYTDSRALQINGISYGDAETGNTEGAANIYTLGARIKGAVGGFDYTAELDWQGGNTFSDGDVDAMAYVVNVGYTLPVDMSPRLYVEFIHADGDDDATDQDAETFNQLFPTGHAHLGYMDLVGFQNIEAWRIGASIKPTKALYVQADYWNFRLNEEKDYWYNAAGARVNSTAVLANNNEDDLGSEIDLTVKYKYADNLSLEGGYSIFYAGDIQERSAANGGAGYADDDDQSWFYAQVKLTF